MVLVFASLQNDSDDEDEGAPELKRVKTVLYMCVLIIISFYIFISAYHIIGSALLSHSPSFSISFSTLSLPHPRTPSHPSLLPTLSPSLPPSW